MELFKELFVTCFIKVCIVSFVPLSYLPVFLKKFKKIF